MLSCTHNQHLRCASFSVWFKKKTVCFHIFRFIFSASLVVFVKMGFDVSELCSYLYIQNTSTNSLKDSASKVCLIYVSHEGLQSSFDCVKFVAKWKQINLVIYC